MVEMIKRPEDLERNKQLLMQCSHTVLGGKAGGYNTSLHQVTIHIQQNHFFLFHFILIMTKTFLIIYFKEYNCIQVFINIYERLTEMERA
jgi:hypothetical protein